MPYPLGLPPDLHRPRVIVYHRLPGRRTARVTHAHPNIQCSADDSVYVFWKHFDVKICTVFDKPLRFSSIRLCDPRSLHRALLVIIVILLITLSVYAYKRKYMVARINIVGT